MLQTIPPGDLQRVRAGLHLGRVMSGYQDTFQRGDFLVRSILGIDPRGGLIATELMRVGQTVRFHVRDAESAEEDLRELLNALDTDLPVAGLLFTGNGRGSRLFPRPDHDAATILELPGPIPVSGFLQWGKLARSVDVTSFMDSWPVSLSSIAPIRKKKKPTEIDSVGQEETNPISQGSKRIVVSLDRLHESHLSSTSGNLQSDARLLRLNSSSREQCQGQEAHQNMPRLPRGILPKQQSVRSIPDSGSLKGRKQ
ncbi:FIST C-terminal domain-containing protein [Tautonia rosea]|uniref:FIST C-terminal domain-containing protein n=1 Tax=Tautonia rosea TaxID=2728037 RepID=UPI0036F425B7